jgi:cation diffusion facilitator CzcD-associated flavoprotein CzcO
MTKDASTASAERPFDPAALHARYMEERDKRIRADGQGQYRALAGRFAKMDADPYVDPGFARDPIDDETEIAVIGGGFGGLMTAAHLRESGVEDIRMIEKGGDFGGTWYWNRYPGAACDVESYIYLPLLEQIGTMPTEKYATAPEILEHCRAIARHYRLYDQALLQTEVTELRWDEDALRWIVRTNRGDCIKARFVSISNGFLHKPKLPGIPGMEAFKGHAFHTSRWDYAYTGGDSAGNLTGLADKRVGIIGTGATSVQCIPHLARWAQQLYVFQRTPSSIDVRNNYKTDPEWAESLHAGWQRERMENFEACISGQPVDVDLVADGWTDIVRNLTTIGRGSTDMAPEQMAENLQLADFQKMEQVRARVDSVVSDPATAEALKPYYNQFCKRPCFHDDYLPAFNRPNVTLVDTNGQGVERITAKGVVVDGREYELDCLIFATGFETGTQFESRAGYEIYGRGGISLTEKWKHGISTLHGMHVHGFPNCFFVLNNVQSGVTVNFPLSLDEQGKHVSYLVRSTRERQARVLEVSEEAEDAWVEKIIRMSNFRRKFQQECTPGYYNDEGHVSTLRARNGAYGAGWATFQQELGEWRAEGSMPGMELKS